MFKILVKGVSSFVSGGWFALIGACGAFLGESGANIIKNVADYIWFDAENGYLKDNPGKEDEPVVKRLWEVMK